MSEIICEEKKIKFPRWVSINDREPPINGFYYWKGKGNYGGYDYYYCEVEGEIEGEGKSRGHFEFSNSVPVNKVDREYLLWLDEGEEEEEK